jgi:dephospho-CoA kinase
MLSFKQYLSEGVNDPAIFKVVFMAGGPGSGKSFVSGKTGLTSLGLKFINSDPAFEAALKKAKADRKAKKAA